MSSIAPSARLGWRLLPGVVAAAAAVIAASLLIGALRAQPVTFSTGDAEGLRNPPAIETVPWRTEASAVGAGRKLSKAERVRFAHQKDRVRGTVRDLADAIALHPGAGLPDAARHAMTAGAVGSLLKQAPELPRGVQELEIVERTADIGIQAPRFRAAIAQLHVVVRAAVEGRTIKWRDDYTFWLQRSEERWRVMSFDLDRTRR